MSVDSAKALCAKILSDTALQEEFSKVTTEEAFNEFIAKHGYTCSMDEYKAAMASVVKDEKLTEETVSQISGGLSFVGIDYTVVAATQA